MFRPSPKNNSEETEPRRRSTDNLLKFGVEYLDDAFVGIFPDDLILLGAPSGAGKTQLCCNIALANLKDGKRVHYIALEASQYEIERRIKYRLIAHMYFNDPARPRLNRSLTYDRWLIGEFMEDLAQYEELATGFFNENYQNLFLYYKQDKFDVTDMIEQVVCCAEETDLIMIDHVHYFDFDDDNENRAMKQIAKVARKLALENGKPIILVAHLRKRDRYNDDLVPGMDEFHGSSDLVKIATKVVTIAPGGVTQDGKFETFFRTSKNRNNGSATRYCGRVLFNPKGNVYEKEYKIGWANQTRKKGFEELDHNIYPEWAKRPGAFGGGYNHVVKVPSVPAPRSRWPDVDEDA